jgi:hypothetical protein
MGMGLDSRSKKLWDSSQTTNRSCKKSVETVETVETAGDVEVIEKFKAGVAAKGGVAIETFEAIETAGDVEVKEAEGK